MKIFLIFLIFIIAGCNTYEDENKTKTPENQGFEEPDINNDQDLLSDNDTVPDEIQDEIPDNDTVPDEIPDKDADSVVNIPYDKVQKEGITFQWRIVGANMDVILSAPSTGWVSVGFDPSEQMLNADIKIGYVGGGTAVVEDHYGNTAVTHKNDSSLGGEYNISNVQGKESGGTTVLQFTMPLNSGDSKDKNLKKGDTITIILSYGENDSLSEKHSAVASAFIKL